MATTATIIDTSRTPESAVVHVVNDGVADMAPVIMLKAALIAALLPGPLKEMISRTADLSVFNFATGAAKSKYIRMTSVVGGLNLAFLPPMTTFVFDFVPTGLEYRLFTASGDAQPIASRILVELRAVHANER